MVAKMLPISVLFQRVVTWVTAVIYVLSAIILMNINYSADALGGEVDDDDDFADRTRLHLFEHINKRASGIIITTFLFLITASFIIGYHWVGHKMPAFHELVPESM